MITPSREADVKSITRGNWKAVISRNMRIPERQSFIIGCVGSLLRHELDVYCSDKSQSVLLSQSLDDIRMFDDWVSLLEEMENKMPSFVKLLNKCMPRPIEHEDGNSCRVCSSNHGKTKEDPKLVYSKS